MMGSTLSDDRTDGYNDRDVAVWRATTGGLLRSELEMRDRQDRRGQGVLTTA